MKIIIFKMVITAHGPAQINNQVVSQSEWKEVRRKRRQASLSSWFQLDMRTGATWYQFYTE